MVNSGRRFLSLLNTLLNNEVMKTNPENYKLGFFYFDPKDKRVILPKVNRMLGWTFNFGHPLTYVVLIVFIALLIMVG